MQRWSGPTDHEMGEKDHALARKLLSKIFGWGYALGRNTEIIENVGCIFETTHPAFQKIVLYL